MDERTYSLYRLADALLILGVVMALVLVGMNGVNDRAVEKYMGQTCYVTANNVTICVAHYDDGADMNDPNNR